MSNDEDEAEAEAEAAAVDAVKGALNGDAAAEILSLPKLGKFKGKESKKKNSTTPPKDRKPAPTLLNEEANEGLRPSPTSLALTLSLDGFNPNSAADPLSNPAAAKATHTFGNPPASHVRMNDDQLKAALDRWEAQEEEQSVAATPQPSLLSKLCPNRTPAASTTLASSAPPSPASIIAGAVACLCSATLGAGILSLPYAMAQAGMIYGMSMLILSALATSYSIQLLVQAMQVVYYADPSTPSNTEKTYEDLVEVCLGKKMRRVAEACMLIFCGGAAVAYVIAVGDILQQSGAAKKDPAVAMIGAWAVVMVPLSMLKTMKSLECASSIGISSIATLVLAALYHYIEHPGEQAPQSVIAWWQYGNEEESHSIWMPTQGALSILRACPIILFAFSCQVNVCAIYDEMPGQQAEQQPTRSTTSTEETENEDAENPPQPATTSSSSSMACAKYNRMKQVTWCAVGICALLYSSISIIALLDFGSLKMTPNILSSYNPESIMQVAFIGMAIAVVLAYPMNIFPARVTLLGIVRSWKQRQSATNNDNDLEAPLLPVPGDSVHNSTASTADEPRELSEVAESATSSVVMETDSIWAHVLSTLFLTSLSLGLALVAPNISVVFGLLGGTSSSVLGFVMPGLLGYMTADDFYLVGTSEADEKAATRTKVLSMILVVAGILVGIVTTAVTVYSTFAGR